MTFFYRGITHDRHWNAGHALDVNVQQRVLTFMNRPVAASPQ